MYIVAPDDISRLREQLTTKFGSPDRVQEPKGWRETWFMGDGKKNVTWREYSGSGGATIDFNKFEPDDKLDKLKRWHIKE